MSLTPKVLTHSNTGLLQTISCEDIEDYISTAKGLENIETIVCRDINSNDSIALLKSITTQLESHPYTKWAPIVDHIDDLKYERSGLIIVIDFCDKDAASILLIVEAFSGLLRSWTEAGKLIHLVISLPIERTELELRAIPKLR